MGKIALSCYSTTYFGIVPASIVNDVTFMPNYVYI